MSQLMFLAILPGILIIIYIFRKDKVEKEPAALIIKMILLGVISCIPASFLEGAIEQYLPSYPEGSFGYAITISFLSAGLIEEICKFAFLRIGIWNNKEFNYRFDGVVYGVAVAVGFAMFENMLYVMDGGISVAITRAFLSVPLHAFCGAFMGALFGMAKKHSIDGNKSKSIIYKFGAIIVPICIHGAYDTMAFWEWEYSYICLLVYVVILYIVGIKVINHLSRDDWKMSFYHDDYGYGSSAYDRASGGSGSNFGNNYTSGYDNSYSSGNMENRQGWREFDGRSTMNNRMTHFNGYSIAGLVLGIIAYLSLTVFVIVDILAIIFSAIGLRKTPPGMGNIVAKVGLILGITSTILGVLIGGYTMY